MQTANANPVGAGTDGLCRWRGKRYSEIARWKILLPNEDKHASVQRIDPCVDPYIARLLRHVPCTVCRCTSGTVPAGGAVPRELFEWEFTHATRGGKVKRLMRVAFAVASLAFGIAACKKAHEAGNDSMSAPHGGIAAAGGQTGILRGAQAVSSSPVAASGDATSGDRQ
ncbi:hypothetical protein [Paraburkholderia megapolitana]|uniref:hypothetical protein n=1 Tax=Paraburkholderia megapolitana TaxID=420953 RepID=UPI0038B7E2B2